MQEAPRPGLADDVRALLPRAVDVRVVSDRPEIGNGETPPRKRENLSPRELFTQYLHDEGRAPDTRLVALFDELLDEAV